MTISHGIESTSLELEASALVSLLERGLDHIRRGYYTEGLAFFIHACEQLPHNQIQLAALIDTLTQSCTSCWEAQRKLHEASKNFAKADAEQQAQLNFLEEKLLPLLKNNINETPHPVAQPLENTSKNKPGQFLQPLPGEMRCTGSPTVSSLANEDNGDNSPPTCSLAFPQDHATLPPLSITCFGRFVVRRLDKPVVLCPNRNGQTILRYLIAQLDHSATMDILMTTLWPEDEPEATQNKLHIAVSALRRSLNNGYTTEPGRGYIICENRNYRLNPAVAVKTDVDDFLEYYRMGQQTDQRRLALYEQACFLYTGPFLSEDMYADWSFIQREQLSQKYIAICKVLADHYLHLQRYEDVAKWATAILKENRCDESAHQKLMQVHAAQGCRAEAIRQFQQCERILREELGIQPMPETSCLMQKILTCREGSCAPPLEHTPMNTAEI